MLTHHKDSLEEVTLHGQEVVMFARDELGDVEGVLIASGVRHTMHMDIHRHCNSPTLMKLRVL